MKYRREIDGLRALAIIPVILFHADFGGASGGYVGVDVFFVISGYLITSIILEDLRQNRFSLVTFYERRARRILPALFFVTAISLPFAWNWLFPYDLREFSQSLIGTFTFTSNFLFWHKSGYFDSKAELKPFLHTWSLSVEEQYYLIFPVLILLCWRLRKEAIPFFIILFILLSIALSQWSLYYYPQAAFFSLPTRMWELLTGAFVAWLTQMRGNICPSRTVSEIFSLLGLGLILYAILCFDKTTPFPGINALFPVAGTALFILFASSQTFVGRLLSISPLVGIGLISYSAYLWHQPIFAFARHRSVEGVGTATLLFLSLLTLLFAYLTWKYIESPFRSKGKVSQRTIVSLALGVSFVYVALGGWGHLSGGMFVRSESSEIVKIQRRFLPVHGLGRSCALGESEAPECTTGDSPEVMVWGDSYAMHLVPGLLASHPTLKLSQHTLSACAPILGIAPIIPKNGISWSSKCLEFNERAIGYLEQTPSIRFVIMSSPFDEYFRPNATVMKKGGEVRPADKEVLVAMNATLETIKSLGKVPVIVSPTPQSGRDIGGCLKKTAYYGGALDICDFPTIDSSKYQERVWRFLRRLEGDVRVVWLSELLCENDRCKASVDGVPVYVDSGHLTREGSELIGKKVDLYEVIAHAL